MQRYITNELLYCSKLHHMSCSDWNYNYKSLLSKSAILLKQTRACTRDIINDVPNIN